MKMATNKITYKQVCAVCGSYDVEYIGSEHHSKWRCNNCKGYVKVKTKKAIVDV